MNFYFYIKCSFAVFALTQNGFAYDSLVQHYGDRQATHNRGGSVDSHTVAINQILSTEDLIDPNLHDDEKKKRVMQAVMASVIIHGARHSLSSKLPQPVINPVFENHFKILGLTEKITNAINQTKVTVDLKDFRLLEEYSGINKDTFLDWLSETCIDHVIHDLALKFRPTVDMGSTILSPAHVSPPFMQNLPPQHLSPTPTSRSLEEITLFDNPVVKDEYKQLGVLFTLAVTEQETNDALRVLPGLDRRQQELGFNSWGLGYTDGDGFHNRAQSWGDSQYNQYFEKGIMREIVFLLTGVGESGVNKVGSEYYSDESKGAQARILLSLSKEMGLGEKRHSGSENALIDSVIRKRNARNSIYTEDARGNEKPCVSYRFLGKPPTPLGYQIYKFRFDGEMGPEDADNLYYLTLCVEHVVIETMKVLSTDSVVLSLAKKFHKQKLIEERIRENQRARLGETNTDGKWEAVGPALDRENKLAEITNRALFKLIEAKIKHALEVYIFPLKAGVSRDEDGELTSKPPIVNVAEIQAYMPDFMENADLKKILDAEYIPIM
jgi:hypothetical protein